MDSPLLAFLKLWGSNEEKKSSFGCNLEHSSLLRKTLLSISFQNRILQLLHWKHSGGEKYLSTHKYGLCWKAKFSSVNCKDLIGFTQPLLNLATPHLARRKEFGGALQNERQKGGGTRKFNEHKVDWSPGGHVPLGFGRDLSGRLSH